jgi:hypothetical protein
MPAQKILRKSLILAKLEATYGTDPVPTGSNAILVSIPEYDLKGDRRERDYIRSSLSPIGFGIGAKRATIKFKTELKGANVSLTPKTATRLEPLWQACGCTAADDSTTSRKYTPAADPDAASVSSCTIYFYLDGILYSMVGCRGNAVLDFSVDGHPEVEFTMTGMYVAPAAAANATVTTWEDHTPPVCLGVGLTVASYSPAGLRKVSLDLGMNIAEVKDMQAASGLSEVYISARAPKLNLEFDMDVLASYDPYTKFSAGTLEAIGMLVGSATGNKFAFTCPKCQLEEPKVVNVDGRAGYQLTYQCVANAGDDEFRLDTK